MPTEAQEHQQQRIVLAAQILSEEKNLLTLERNEYALLAEKPYCDVDVEPFYNKAVLAAAEDFRTQVDYVESIITNATAKLKAETIARLEA
jgi:hypothetical protein